MLIDLIKNESKGSNFIAISAAIVAGISNAGLLAVINSSASKVTQDKIAISDFLTLMAILFVFIICTRYSMVIVINRTEQAIHKIRMRILNKIRHTELRFIENTGSAPIYTTLTRDTTSISQSITAIINGFQSFVILIACLFYIAWVSMTGFVLATTTISISVALYLRHHSIAAQELKQINKKEKDLFDSLNDILQGFKEIKINNIKDLEVFDHFKQVAKTSEKFKTRMGVRYADDYIYSQVFFYILLAVIIFILPRLDPEHASSIVKVSTTILFLIGPFNALVMAIPIYTIANDAASNICQLEKSLDNAAHDSHSSTLISDFKELTLKNLQFEYRDKDDQQLFSVGPINLTVKKGEILYIVGGNGSGKSTLLKMLTGLYQPISGEIMIDGTPIKASDSQSFRELFGIVFTDFHLFEQFYGLENIDDQQVKKLLFKMEINQKTDFKAGKFTHTQLSTGQRKRLALVIALMENKKIYILDEVAADQDPQFKKYFYECILKELQQQGKTIIAVTHDDHYFHTADTVRKMDYGQLYRY